MNDKQRAQNEIAFERERTGLAVLRGELELVPHWLPAAGLREMVARREAILADAQARLDAKPVVAVVGPTGCGKSTLINALVGRDNLAAMGVNRPTTRDIAVIARTAGDARQLLDYLPHSDLRCLPCPSTLLRDAILLDTPDTDSAECLAHRPLLEQALQLSDALLCVFDASNPKRRDNIEELSDWVNVFPGEELYLVLNRSDRIPESEIQDVVNDFLSHISRAWARKHDRVFRVSARSALQAPNWPEGEKPLHGTNEIGALRDRLNELGGGTFFIDRRIERARHLREGVSQAVHECAAAHRESLASIREDLSALEREITDDVVNTLCTQGGDDAGGILALLYGGLTQRWCGPVGLFIGLWRRIVDFWTPLSLLRSFNPVRLAWALMRSFRALKNPESFEQELVKTLSSCSSRRDCTGAKIRLAEAWPDLADRLVAAEFDPAIRESTAFVEVEPLLDLSEQTWGQSVKKAVDAACNRLSRAWIQWVLNAPPLLGLAAIGVIIVREFARGSYLPAHFLVHAVALLLVLWLLPSWVLQLLARRSLPRIADEALAHAKQTMHLASDARLRAQIGVIGEVGRVLRLARKP